MISKSQLRSLIKDNLLWPGWNWVIKETVDGIQNTVNEEVDGLVEILIEYLYQLHINTVNWTDIFNVDTSDKTKEITGIPCQNNNLHPNDIIRIDGTLNYNDRYTVYSADTNTVYIYNPYKPEKFRLKYTCDICDYYKITEQEISGANYCPICTSRYPNKITLLKYDPPRIYKISEDGYHESDPVNINLYEETIKSDIVLDPIFLPHVGYKIGYAYNKSLSIAQNRKFIRSAIDVYRIKGTMLSIKRLMRLMGYDCKINEPFKEIFKLNKSKLGGSHKLTDWGYYHDGIFEIETDDISLPLYKQIITSTVQPAGTRMVGRNNISMPIIPMLRPSESVDNLYKAIYIESVIRLLKSGDIYDVKSSSRRSKSGDRHISGFYISKGIEMFAQAFRRVFDSEIFSLADLTTSYIVETPAGQYSKGRGPYSGSVKRTFWNTTEYNELSPLDLQLPFSVRDYQARLPGRSDHGVRSGKFSQSGTEGIGWNKSRFWIQNYGPIISLLSEDVNFAPNGLERSVFTDLKLTSSVGNQLSVNRVLSNFKRVHGFELITEILYKGISDWENKLYYMYDDGTRHVPVYEITNNFAKIGFISEKHLQPIEVTATPKVFTRNKSKRSGKRSIYGLNRDIGIDLVASTSAIKVCFDEYKSISTETLKYKTLQVDDSGWDPETKNSMLEFYHKPFMVDLSMHRQLRSNTRSSNSGARSGRPIKQITSEGFNILIDTTN